MTMLAQMLPALIEARSRDAEEIVFAMMKELWLGRTLIVPGIIGAADSSLFKMGENICAVSFATEEGAESYLRGTLPRGIDCEMREETLEAILTRIEHTEYTLYLASSPRSGLAMPKGMIIEALNLTRRLTGGRLPSEDFPLMRYHMKSLGDGDAAERAAVCGCFQCGATFPGSEIRDMMTERDGRRTAKCPKCGMDSVVAGMDDVATLKAMRERFFGGNTGGSMENKAMYMACMKQRATEYPEGDVTPSRPVERLEAVRRRILAEGGKR